MRRTKLELKIEERDNRTTDTLWPAGILAKDTNFGFHFAVVGIGTVSHLFKFKPKDKIGQNCFLGNIPNRRRHNIFILKQSSAVDNAIEFRELLIELNSFNLNFSENTNKTTSHRPNRTHECSVFDMRTIAFNVRLKHTKTWKFNVYASSTKTKCVWSGKLVMNSSLDGTCNKNNNKNKI